MALFMKDFGKEIFITVGENCITPAEICMKENSSMIWLKASAFTSMQMVVSMSATGTKTNSTALEKKNGTTVVSTKGSTKMPQKRGKENTVGQMETPTLENGEIIC